MALFDHRQTLGPGSFLFDAGIRDIIALDGSSGPVIYTATLSGGGMTAFRTLPGGGLAEIGSLAYPGPLLAGAAPVMALLTPGSDRLLHVSGIGPGGADLDPGGGFDGWHAVPGAGGPLRGAVALGSGGSGLLVGGRDGGIASIAVDSSGAAETRGSLSGFAGDSFVVTGAGDLVSASSSQNAVALLSLAPDGSPGLTATIGAADGLGIGTPSALATVGFGGTDYVIAAGAGSSSLTVLRVENGTLEVSDHIVDDLATRFQDVLAIDAIEVNGRAFVAAGGGDDGLSLFEITPGGQLVHVETLIDSTTTTLANVVALALADGGGLLRIVAAGESDRGLSVFTRPVSEIAAPIIGGMAGEVLTGSGLDDLIHGGAGDDVIDGRGGRDILIDGDGADRLTGGSGADTFVLAQDGRLDTITDFEPGLDRLDLSAYSQLYAISNLTITPTASGARLTFRDEVIDLQTRSGQPLDPASLTTRDILGVTRPPLAPIGREIDGSGSGDSLSGGSGADRLRGFSGDDDLFGLGGGDLLLGDDGADYLSGGSGADRIYGGADDDIIDGDDHADLAAGGGGADLLSGGPGADLLLGGPGNDRIFGNDGNDVLRGSGGADELVGGEGHDRLYGGAGADTLSGEAGQDRLYGGAGDDRLSGGADPDIFVFTPDFGTDYVADFDPHMPGEVIDLSALEVGTFDTLADRFLAVADGVAIDFGGDGRIVLGGLAASDLGPDDFLF